MAKNIQLDSEILSKIFDGIESGNSHLVVKVDMSGDKLKIIENQLRQRIAFISDKIKILDDCSRQKGHNCPAVRHNENCRGVGFDCERHLKDIIIFPDGDYNPAKVKIAVMKLIEELIKERNDVEKLINRYHEIVLKLLLKSAQ